ncbi:hypothetical protein GGI09_008467, partial [Coemansia sp. S100]
LEEATAQRQAMETEAEEHLSSLDGMEKDISYLRMEHSMEQESEEQALAQLKAKKDELARLSSELEAKRRLLESRKDAYRKRRPLTAVEHSERMLSELARVRGSVVQDDESLHGKRDVFVERLSEMVGNSDAIELTNRFVDKIFANTIDSVANEDTESMEARRASRRLSMSATTPSGRVLAAQLLCILYTQSRSEQAGMPEDDLRTQIAEFARERQWNPDLVVQAMYEVFGKRLAKRYRESRTHMVRLLWE